MSSAASLENHKDRSPSGHPVNVTGGFGFRNVLFSQKLFFPRKELSVWEVAFQSPTSENINPQFIPLSEAVIGTLKGRHPLPSPPPQLIASMSFVARIPSLNK